jgi:hypothetical protein
MKVLTSETAPALSARFPRSIFVLGGWMLWDAKVRMVLYWAANTDRNMLNEERRGERKTSTILFKVRFQSHAAAFGV